MVNTSEITNDIEVTDYTEVINDIVVTNVLTDENVEGDDLPTATELPEGVQPADSVVDESLDVADVSGVVYFSDVHSDVLAGNVTVTVQGQDLQCTTDEFGKFEIPSVDASTRFVTLEIQGQVGDKEVHGQKLVYLRPDSTQINVGSLSSYEKPSDGSESDSVNLVHTTTLTNTTEVSHEVNGAGDAEVNNVTNVTEVSNVFESINVSSQTNITDSVNVNEGADVNDVTGMLNISDITNINEITGVNNVVTGVEVVDQFNVNDITDVANTINIADNVDVNSIDHVTDITNITNVTDIVNVTETVNIDNTINLTEIDDISDIVDIINASDIVVVDNTTQTSVETEITNILDLTNLTGVDNVINFDDVSSEEGISVDVGFTNEVTLAADMAAESDISFNQEAKQIDPGLEDGFSQMEAHEWDDDTDNDGELNEMGEHGVSGTDVDPDGQGDNGSEWVTGPDLTLEGDPDADTETSQPSLVQSENPDPLLDGLEQNAPTDGSNQNWADMFDQEPETEDATPEPGNGWVAEIDGEKEEGIDSLDDIVSGDSKDGQKKDDGLDQFDPMDA